MLESNQDRHEVTFKFPPQLPQTNLQNSLAKHHHKYIKLTEIDKFHLHTTPDTTKTTPMAWACLKNGQIIIPKIALRWTPAGKIPRRRPKTTW